MALRKISASHIRWLDFGSFPGNILFVVGFSFKETMAHLKIKKLSQGWIDAFESTKDLWDGDCAAFATKLTINEDKEYYIIAYNKLFDFSDNAHAILSHEVLHIISYNLSNLMDTMKENEAFCYTHTHILQQCYTILRS